MECLQLEPYHTRNTSSYFKIASQRFANHFHYVSSVKVSKPTAFLLHYSDKASFPLRCFNEPTDFGAYGLFEDKVA